MIKEYSAGSNNNQSVVIYCFDCDDYDSNQRDSEFLDEVKEYCEDNGYRFVWFCKDIEQVYLNKKVADKEKKSVSFSFKEKKLIESVDCSKLLVDAYRSNTSNIMRILDQYLKRKDT